MSAGTATVAFVGLGSNLGDPVENVRSGIRALGAIPGCSVRGVSSLYVSPPMGPADQPDYINAVVGLETRLPAPALLDALLAIEVRHGRVRTGTRWGPRTLDLDILVFGTETLSDGRLTIPHPGIAQRPFVLQPLHEIAPELIIPGHGTVRELLARLGPGGTRRR